jgi:hypothetical protein
VQACPACLGFPAQYQCLHDLFLTHCRAPHLLQEASKARETKLRKAGIQGRARVASELREMDDAVAALSRELAVSRGMSHGGAACVRQELWVTAA